jgi:hypothetical protein
MKQGFFNDHKGKLSVMRLGFYTLIVGGLVFAFIFPDNETGYLGIIGAGVGLKWAQKYQEVKQ